MPRSIYRATIGAVEEGLRPQRLMEAMKEGGELWVDIDSNDRAQHALLEKLFNFHPLAIDDTLSPKTRVKIEEYGNYLFLVVRSVSLDTRTDDPYDIDTVNLYCFLAPHCLVTVHGAPVRAVDEVRQRLGRSTEKVERGVEML